MAILVATRVVLGGAIVPIVACAAGGDKFVNTGIERIRVTNNYLTNQVVTIDAQNFNGVSFIDPYVIVPGSGVSYIGPFDPRIFTDATGYVNLSYSSVVTLFIELFS